MKSDRRWRSCNAIMYIALRTVTMVGTSLSFLNRITAPGCAGTSMYYASLRDSLHLLHICTLVNDRCLPIVATSPSRRSTCIATYGHRASRLRGNRLSEDAPYCHLSTARRSALSLLQKPQCLFSSNQSAHRIEAQIASSDQDTPAILLYYRRNEPSPAEILANYYPARKYHRRPLYLSDRFSFHSKSSHK